MKRYKVTPMLHTKDEWYGLYDSSTWRFCWMAKLHSKYLILLGYDAVEFRVINKGDL